MEAVAQKDDGVDGYVLVDTQKIPSDKLGEIRLKETPVREDNYLKYFRRTTSPEDWQRDAKEADRRYVAHCEANFSNWAFSPVLLTPILGFPTALIVTIGTVYHHVQQTKTSGYQAALKPKFEAEIRENLQKLELDGLIPTTFEMAHEHFRKLMMKFHPDKATDETRAANEAQAKIIGSAWEKLYRYRQEGFKLSEVFILKEIDDSTTSASESPIPSAANSGHTIQESDID